MPYPSGLHVFWRCDKGTRHGKHSTLGPTCFGGCQGNPCQGCVLAVSRTTIFNGTVAPQTLISELTTFYICCSILRLSFILVEQEFISTRSHIRPYAGVHLCVGMVVIQKTKAVEIEQLGPRMDPLRNTMLCSRALIGG